MELEIEHSAPPSAAERVGGVECWTPVMFEHDSAPSNAAAAEVPAPEHRQQASARAHVLRLLDPYAASSRPFMVAPWRAIRPR